MLVRSGEDWTPENIRILTELWANESLSARQIGNVIGMSKNAVIGKAGRLGLPRKKRGVRQQSEAAKAGVRARKAKELARAKLPPKPIVIQPPIAGGIPLMDLADHHCRAIIGYDDGGQARYCGATKRHHVDIRGAVIRMASTGEPLFHGSFCDGHAAIYFQPPWRR